MMLARVSRRMHSLMSTSKLARTLESHDNVIVLDASWHLDASRDAQAEFDAKHIPGAHFFDIDKWSAESALPHMLPSEAVFINAVAQLQLRKDVPVVVYDTAGVFSSPRAWYTLSVFGHSDVSVLDGGLPKWIAEGRPIAGSQGNAEGRALEKHHVEVFDRFASIRDIGGEEWTKDEGLIQNKQRMLSVSAKVAEAKTTQMPATHAILDARPADRFHGRAPEPRPHTGSGHMPGSDSVPLSSLLEPSTSGANVFKSREELEKIFAGVGVTAESPDNVITTCGSGVTAAGVLFALHRIGRPLSTLSLYDGSWAEWGGSNDAPVDVTS